MQATESSLSECWVGVKGPTCKVDLVFVQETYLIMVLKVSLAQKELLPLIKEKKG